MNSRNEDNAKNIKINKLVVQNPPSDINIINPPPKLQMQQPNTFNFTTPITNLNRVQHPVTEYIPNHTYNSQNNGSISLWGDVKTLSTQPSMTFNKFPSATVPSVNNTPTLFKPININPPPSTVYESKAINTEPMPVSTIQTSQVINPVYKSSSLFDGSMPMNSRVYQPTTYTNTGTNAVYPDYRTSGVGSSVVMPVYQDRAVGSSAPMPVYRDNAVHKKRWEVVDLHNIASKLRPVYNPVQNMLVDIPTSEEELYNIVEEDLRNRYA